MALPLHLLYELSVLISRFWARKDEEKQAEEA
jgi:Sec-independent protein secretion pathway component TatC